jgi:hypoxanthine phosphoribosyltransferase
MNRSSVPRIEKGKGNVPVAVRNELSEVLIDAETIQKRVRQVAAAIQKDFAGRELLVIALLNGTVIFLADLLRELSMPVRLDFLGVSSYRGGTSPRELIYTKDLRLDVKGRDVLIVDDILDTGRTLHAVFDKVRALQPRRLRTCTLLDKPARRVLKIKADYTGFRIPDVFAVGYGLDYAEKFRNLPFIGILKPEVYEAKLPASS